MDIQKAIEEINANINSITDPVAKAIISQLLNIIEALTQENKVLKAENQKLRDENNKLKGGNGKPNIRPQSKQNLSSEKERKKKKKNKKSKKNKKNIKIDHTVELTVDTNVLPEDAVFKGYQTVIVQDILIQSNNTLFKKEVYYSASLNKTFMAPMPDGYDGEFGPVIKSFVITQHFQHKMTEPAIVQFLQDHGVQISAATVSRIITDNKEDFHAEKTDIIQAGLPSSIYQQMDDTGARVNGQNYYTHILCNEHYTAYFTRENKNRLTILEILSQKELTFEFNEITYALMTEMNLSFKVLTNLQNQLNLQTILNRQEIDAILDNLFPIPGKYQRSRQIILEASAIVAYQKLPHATKILLTDDAPQFKQITELLALCWIHDGRLYKKLAPVFAANKDKLCSFLDNYWDYYHELLEYKKAPTIEFAKNLDKEFDVIFSTTTGYEQLDDRINRTRLKKDSLLLVLQYPELPLHNNNSELGARAHARYRDTSFQTKNQKGTESKDSLMTIIETGKKLSVNVFNYIFDRVSKNFSMPSLANLVTEQGLQ
ncbi:MAG: IS66 family transposase [Gammaproteobacteria bacterium]